MNRTIRISLTILLAFLTINFSGLVVQSQNDDDDKQEKAKPQPKERDFDRPEEADDLNRELWESARQTPYADVLSYVAAAQRASRAREKNEIELPNGWRISPAGQQVEVGRLPYEVVSFAGKLVVLNNGYYIREPQEVSVIDPTTAQVVKTLRLNSLFPSAVVGIDGDLYISGGFDQKVFRVDREFNVVREYQVPGFTGGLAPVDATHLAVGLMATKNEKGDYINGKLVLLNTLSGQIEKETSIGYFPYALRYLNEKIFVTLLGENKLLVFDKQVRLLKTVIVGRTPQEMCSDGRRVYVTNTGSDSLSVVDLKTHQIVSTINVASPESRFGRTPTSCAIEGQRLYVTLAGINAVAVINKQNGKTTGLIPTGWYPTKVITEAGRLVVASAKGIQARRPNPDGPQPVANRGGDRYVLTLLKGSVSLLPTKEISSQLPAMTRQVESSSPLFSVTEGSRLPIRHVFYIVKENRTYDQVLGDLGRGNGDPSLTLFGNDISPIHHQIAREFVTLDNFFVNGEISVLGHSFTTSGYASPFLEWMGNVAYSVRWKGYPFGTVPAVTSPAYLWDALDEKHVDYRIYGENYFLFTRAYRIFVETYGVESVLARKFYQRAMAAASLGDRGNEFYQLAKPYYGQANTREDAYRLLGDKNFIRGLSTFLTGDDSAARAMEKDDALRRKFADYLYHYPFSYRSWDLKHSDLERAAAWKRDFENQLKLDHVAQFHYIWLPNDHTDGASERILSPFQFVAQNDAALGTIVETISHSPVWRNSLILVAEDDAQNGPDHVDATRTLALAIGPYVKRDAVVSHRYDQLSMLRTMELFLGLDPMNLGDRLAVPMFGIFTDKPNYQPFVPTKPSERLPDADRQRYEQLRVK
jgi:YVTN family beta-propeller protein